MRAPSTTRHLPFIIYIFLMGVSPSVGDFGGLSSRGISAVVTGGCANTISGRWFVADDHGRFCSRSAFDSSTGCCPSDAPTHSCDSCTNDDTCCSIYEHCVSCCLSPSHEPQKRMVGVPRGFGKKETGEWSTPFEYCRAVCRTTSRSTDHENAFIDTRRYCFSPGGRPHLPIPPARPLDPGATTKLLVGDKGTSCDDTCRKQSLECNPKRFVSINNCNALRNAFICEAGCGPSFDPGADEFPGYVDGNAPKGEWPAYCFTQYDEKRDKQGLVQVFNCTATGESTKRLCPCDSVPGLGGGDLQHQLDSSNSAEGGGGGDNGGGMVA